MPESSTQPELFAQTVVPFNSPLETGLRALIILAACFPRMLDLQRLLHFDYLLVHSGDVGGPPSIHPALPLRSGELLVRRGLIERGLLLMISKKLVRRLAQSTGFYYQAEDGAAPFLDALVSSYISDVKERAEWVTATFGETTDEDLRALLNTTFRQWTSEFETLEEPGDGRDER